ncbi:MAG TPA: DUF177 domain-containing protein [Saprospiraceae bacterium]|nr:DUF177 domain-containing protein [Saprospiraceae bacterium]
MNVLDHFSIPYKGLKIGIHHFKFEVDTPFFETFEKAYVTAGNLIGLLELDKRSDLAIASLNIKGEVYVPCDRCLDQLDYPIDGDFKLHIKFSKVEEEQDEVIFIDPDSSHINFAKFVYDSICLSVPLVKYHEYEDDCNPEIIKKLNESRPTSKVESGWNILDGLNLKED